MQFRAPDDEQIRSKCIEARNKLIVKQKFCASSCLNFWRLELFFF